MATKRSRDDDPDSPRTSRQTLKRPMLTLPDGDFELVSSDGITFHVDSLTLLGSSAVFRNAYRMGTGEADRRLVFTDNDIEHSAVLTHFESLITVGQLQPLASSTEWERADIVRRTLVFCAKYECVAARQAVLFSLREMSMSGAVRRDDAFRLGTMADDPDTCVASLESPRGSASDLAFQVGIELVKRRTTPIPVEYTWALYHDIPEKHGPQEPAQFKKLVHLAKRDLPEWIFRRLPCAVDDLEWTEGDVQITSSDNVRFKVHSYELAASGSAPLREMLGPNSELEFTCRQTETASVIHLFLRLITSGELVLRSPGTMGYATLRDVDHLAAFLVRHECGMALRLLCFHVRTLVVADPSLSFNGFVIGAVADDVETCQTCIASGVGRVWDTSFANDDQTPLFSPVNVPLNNHCIFDTRSWSFRQWRSVPPPYLYALDQTFYSRGELTGREWAKKFLTSLDFVKAIAGVDHKYPSPSTRTIIIFTRVDEHSIDEDMKLYLTYTDSESDL